MELNDAYRLLGLLSLNQGRIREEQKHPTAVIMDFFKDIKEMKKGENHIYLNYGGEEHKIPTYKNDTAFNIQERMNKAVGANVFSVGIPDISDALSKDELNESLNERYQQLMDELSQSDGKREVTPKQTPNCAICRWMKQDIDNCSCPDSYDCMAQGGEDCLRIYNSTECKALFEPKEKLSQYTKITSGFPNIKAVIGDDQEGRVLTAKKMYKKIRDDSKNIIDYGNAMHQNGRLEMSQDIESSVVLLKSISDSMFLSGEIRFAAQISGIAENIQALKTKKEK